MARYIEMLTVVFLSIYINIATGFLYQKKDGYEYREVQKSPYEIDVSLTKDKQPMGETAFFRTGSSFRRYVVHTSPDSDNCLIIFPNPQVESRPACSTKRPANLTRFPDDVREKCSDKRAYVLHEYQCEESNRDDRRVEIHKRSCPCTSVTFSYSYLFQYAYDYDYELYTDYFALSIEVNEDSTLLVAYQVQYVYCY